MINSSIDTLDRLFYYIDDDDYKDDNNKTGL